MTNQPNNQGEESDNGFFKLLPLADALYKQHPHWKKLVGTPWENDAPVMAANFASEHIRATDQRIKELEEEIEILRHFGNKDCTAMADAEIRRLKTCHSWSKSSKEIIDQAKQAGIDPDVGGAD